MMFGGVQDDLPDWECGAALVALMARDVEAPCLVVDMRDPKALPPRISFGEAAREKVTRRRQAVELQREFGTLIPHDAFVRANGRGAASN